MSLQLACKVGDLEAGEARCIQLADASGRSHKVALVRDTDGGFHALGDTCTHGDVPLSEGDIEDGTIECWGHGAVFDLETGEPTLPATEPVPVYQLSLDGDDVLVDVDARK